jgi:eukaryotic-like serine/threonine-protein kinase
MLGRTISHYEILEKLGEGGMGVVYKAKDTHLDRFVAIKVLPPERVTDPERRRRFMQEAKAASALNHPNIITIHDIASESGRDFIAMEYVAGKALNQLISRKGLPLGEALKYGVQIADALAAAHAAGIIHRDLKPGNVMIGGTPERAGFVKVLDFGLAKLTDKVEAGEREFTETMRQDAAPSTEDGVILGTVAYMSPEQAEGKKVDTRSDIFSFGAVLYEMLTGRRAFQRDSKLSTLTAILREEPKAAGEIVDGLPGEVERIIARCLRKNPARRFQTMPDLKAALEDVKEESDSGSLGAATAPRQPRRRGLAWAALALAVLVAGGTLWFRSRGNKPPEPTLAALPLTTYPGNEAQPSFSPDGNQVVFVWDGPKQDNFDIYIKVVGAAGDPLRLTTNPARDYSPAWSPDGRSIAFLRELPKKKNAVLLIPALGGPERKLAEIADVQYLKHLNGPYLAWSPDSASLVITDRASLTESGALFVLSIENGEKRKLTFPPAGLGADNGPAFSPDGRSLAFIRAVDVGLGDLYLLGLAEGLKPAGEPRRLTFENQGGASPAWTPDGREIVFANGAYINDLWKIAANGTGKPQRLPSVGESGYSPAISVRARRLAYTRRIGDSDIWRMEIRSKSTSGSSRVIRLITSTRDDFNPDFSPDGKRIAFISARSGSPELWVCDTDGSRAAPLTSFGGQAPTTPRWSPDGERIAFDSAAEGQSDIYVVSAGGGKPQRMTTHPANDGNPSWSHDGRWIYFDSNRTGEGQLWRMPAAGGEPVQLTRKGGFAPRESHDSKFLYFVKSLTGTSLWRVPVEGGEETQLLNSLSAYINLALTDAGLYFVPGESRSIQFLSFASGKVVPIATFDKPLATDLGGLSVSPDGRWLLYTQADQSGSELMLVENFR